MARVEVRRLVVNSVKMPVQGGFFGEIYATNWTRILFTLLLNSFDVVIQSSWLG